MKVFNNKRILIISSEKWDHNFVSKHHYAIQLAREGNTVFFLNPPSQTDSVLQTSYPRLYVVDYRPFLRGLNHLPAFVAGFLYRMDQSKIAAITKSTFDIVWTFDPYRFQDLRVFRCETRIYFAADWHHSRSLERRVAATADIVLSPSRLLLDSIETRTPKFFINHSVADYFFDENLTKAALPGRNNIKVGYVGNLNSKYLHFTLLEEVVKLNFSCDFCFAGDIDDGVRTEKLRRYGNVYFVGLLPNEAIPSFLAACDLLLLCYDTDKYRIEASNAHKIMEYLSSGRLVVSTRVPEYTDRPHLLRVPDSNAGLPELVQQVINKFESDESNSSERRKFALDHLYSRQLRRIGEWIEKIRLNFPR